MARGEGRPVEAKLGGQAGTEVGEHDVGPGKEALDDTRGGRMVQVERQRVLAPVPGDGVTRLARSQRRQLAHGISLDRFHLDDVGPALGEDLRAERDRDELAELDDLDAGERSSIVHGAVA